MFTENFTKYEFPTYGYIKIPKVKLSHKELLELNLKDDCTQEECLKALVTKKFKDKLNAGLIPKEKKQVYIDRVKEELQTFETLGFCGYVLMIYDVINFNRLNGKINSPARGCLTGDSLVRTLNGYKRLDEVNVTDTVFTQSGEYHKVLNTMKYPCDEKLLNIYVDYSSPKPITLTSDHKVLCLKSDKQIGNKDGFDKDQLEWVKAKDLKVNDYLVRVIDNNNGKILEDIDLSIYSKNFDKSYVFESKNVNQYNLKNKDLNIRTINKEINLSRSFLLSVRKNKKVAFRKNENWNLLLEYLKNKNYTITDFINYKPFFTLKYKRYIPIDEDFCYLLGFFIGDGWIMKDRGVVGFALHSENNLQQIDRIKEIIEKYGFKYKLQKHKKKKLVQIIVYSYIFCNVFYDLCPYKTKNKIIPKHFLRLSRNLKMALISGLLDSDGYRNGNLVRYDSISHNLILQVRDLLEEVGYKASIFTRKPKFKNWNTCYKVSARQSNHVESIRSGYNDGDRVFLRISDIEISDKKEEFVYDITVENQHSYQTDSFLVHNSVGGSCVFWLIDCISIDPIEYDLLFARFLSSARASVKEINGETYLEASSLCDVDIDQENLFKDQVRKYIDNKYSGQTASISTVSTFSGKILLKDVLKTVEGANETEAQEGANLIDKKFGNVDSFDESIKDNPKFQEWAKQHDKTILICQQLENLNRNKSVHASAILVCNDLVNDTLPLELSSDKRPVTAFDMRYSQMLGIKLDNLGLRTLDLVSLCLESINKKISDIDIRDSSIYEFLSTRNEFYGLFQIAEGLGKQTVQKIQPHSIEELSLCIALGRPGCMKFIDDYADYKKGKFTPDIDSRLKDILSPTAGFIIFQEQLMKLAVVMGGFTEREADGVRKCISKKQVDKMPEYKQKFVDGAKKNGYEDKFIEEIWQVFIDSSNYSFNKSHSVGYANLTAITTYLKTNFPKQFFLAALKNAKNDPDPIGEIAKIQEELPYFDSVMLPPDIIKSEMDFTLEGKGIRFGLSSIKGIANSTIEKLYSFRKSYENKFQVYESAKQCGLSIGVLSALIQSGALDCQRFGMSRSKMVLEAQLWRLLTDKEKVFANQFGEQFNFNLFDTIKHLKVTNNEKGKPIITEKRGETIKKKFEPYYKIFQLNSKNEDFACYWYEYSLLGFSYSYKLIDIFSKNMAELVNIYEVIGALDGEVVNFVGRVVDKIKEGKSKAKGTRYLSVTVKDETGHIGVLLFNDKIDEHLSNNKNKVKEGDIVYVNGVRKGDAVFANRINIQTHHIYTKLSELEKSNEEQSFEGNGA